MFRKSRVFRVAVFAVQLVTVAIRLHDAVFVHGQCSHAVVAALASKQSTLGPGSSIWRFA